MVTNLMSNFGPYQMKLLTARITFEVRKGKSSQMHYFEILNQEQRLALIELMESTLGTLNFMVSIRPKGPFKDQWNMNGFVGFDITNKRPHFTIVVNDIGSDEEKEEINATLREIFQNMQREMIPIAPRGM